MIHPCLSCGACCARFRIAFHWAEADPALGGVVPPEAVVRWDAHRVALRGTDRKQPHCEQLRGEVGREVNCAIYAQRPTPCRELTPSWENGRRNDQCDRARSAYGMAPLTPEIWTQA